MTGWIVAAVLYVLVCALLWAICYFFEEEADWSSIALWPVVIFFAVIDAISKRLS